MALVVKTSRSELSVLNATNPMFELQFEGHDGAEQL